MKNLQDIDFSDNWYKPPMKQNHGWVTMFLIHVHVIIYVCPRSSIIVCISVKLTLVKLFAFCFQLGQHIKYWL